MKKILVLIALGTFLCATSFSWAFLYEVPILSKEEVKKLSDADLISAYIQVKIEIDASRTFHGKAGFTPKEYEKHKGLLGYVIALRLEMQLRELQPPPIDEWIR